MKSRVDSWYHALHERHSRRNYRAAAIEREKIESLEELIDEIGGSFEGARIVLVEGHDGSIFSGIRGGYGIITGAPSYLAFVLDTGRDGVYERLGFIGEAAVLEATALGLGTCWVSGTFDPAAVKKDIELGPGEKVFAVSPLGYPEEQYALKEKVMSGFAGSRRRKSREQLLLDSAEQWPGWAITAVEAARQAPSAVNRQPWRFRFDAPAGKSESGVGGRILVETAGAGEARRQGDAAKRLDCGIALRHLEVGASYALGGPAAVEFLPPPGVGMVRAPSV